MNPHTPTTISVDPTHPDATTLKRAADALRAGQLVAFPTETVYGLGANALDEAAIAKIFGAKGRPPTNPLIVHIADIADAKSVVADWPAVAQELAEAFWPGPLTLVLPKNPRVPDAVTAGLDTIGVRMPDHAVAREFIRLAGVPIAAPSANRYTEVSPTRAEHVIASLGEAVDIVVDAGPTEVGVESTVLSLVEDGPVILRPGMVTRDQIATVAPGVVYADGAPVPSDETRPSPGLARRHYSPKARVVVVDDVDAGGVQASENVGWIVLEDAGVSGEAVVLGRDPEKFAAGLYNALRELDEKGCETIVVERPPDGETWRAIHDRLSRAAD